MRLVIALAAPAPAQDDGAVDRVLSLNRAGEWAQAAAVAQQLLAGPSAAPRTRRTCTLRQELVYAETRLRQRTAARAALAAFDGECSGVALDGGYAAELSRLRQELAGTVVDSPAAESPPATPSTLELDDDGFWPVGDPVALGIDVQALEQHRVLCAETGADACLVVFRGQIVQEWYSPHYQRPIYAMSTTKSITGLLVGMLVDVPRMRDSGVGFVGDKDAFVERLSPTVEPGTRWDYSNEGAQLLSPVLDRAAGEPIQNYARTRLFQPLAMKDTRLHEDERRHAWTYADMETTPRDLARIGLLMLNRGVWRGRRILSEAWIDASTQPSQRLHPEYGLLWWLHDDPPGFAGHGHLDTDLHVFPALDLIVVRMQARPLAGVAEGTYEVRALPLYKAMVPHATRK